MPTDPAEARKRRKEIIQSHRSEGDASATETGEAAGTASASATTTTSTTSIAATSKTGKGNEESAAASGSAEKKPPKKRKVTADDGAADKFGGSSSPRSSSSVDGSNGHNSKKTQIRYDPDVPMNKEQLAAWRREARRVRNRESAAASRQRIRNRIQELEEEVGQWKQKYSHAIQRLEALEATIAASNSTCSQKPPSSSAAEGGGGTSST
jgi:hypothetical protein